MRARLRRLRGLTVTPEQYARVAYASVIAFALIAISGAAVRLTGSGLGCPDWPRCYGKAYPPLNSHALIEFSNRMITAPVSVAAGLAWLLALRRRPYRRDLMWLGAALPLGVVAQAVLGGLTVRGALDYGFVMGHFALSMLILAAAVALAWRARFEPGERRRSSSRGTVWAVRGLVALGALTIFAGTAATAAGPHAGGSPGQRINRLAFDGHSTMDFVIQRHGDIGFLFGALTLGLLVRLNNRGGDPLLIRALSGLIGVLVLQGIVGIVQYETHLPSELVWVHVSLACVVWTLTVTAGAAAGRPAPAGETEAAERPLARVAA